MIRALAVGLMVAAVASACTRPFTSAPAAKIADVYAGSPTSDDATALLGGGDWWTGAPTFGVRPLDVGATASNVQYSVVRRFANIGTAETWRVRYTQYDKTSSATALMTSIENSAGSGVSGKSAGDKVLYYGEKLSAGGAPYETLTLIRVGVYVIESTWLKRDRFPTVDELGKVATRLVSGLKDATAGKVHGTAMSADDLATLPPPNAYITLLGTARLPIEAVPLMLNAAAPTELATLFHEQAVNDFVFGDYVLDNDTHMEVQAAVFTFTSSTAAGDMFDAFRGSATVDSNGVVKSYNDVTGPGQYDYLITSGAHIGLLICRSTAETDANEAASRACESPLETVATAWSTAFKG